MLNLARALLIKFIYGNQALLDELLLLIGVEVECDGDFNGFDIIALYLYHPEFEGSTTYKLNWKTTTFKKVSTGLETASTLTVKATAC